ncbi:MAG TPA: Crp/Fnr family transcriptional regulator [Gammaproteobacteria bacterium]|nr:Crp/Fnr family transcriptional regulator [Gammaproteobacteria bacterium]
MTENEKRILAAFERLSEEQQRQVVDYAEFLGSRGEGAAAPAASGPAEPQAPQPVEKDPEEGPVQAIKRLRATYPMLDPSKLLDETTTLMSRRYLQDKPEQEVIEEIEETFERHYRHYLSEFEG